MNIDPTLTNNLYILHREEKGHQKFLWDFTVEDLKDTINDYVVTKVFARLYRCGHQKTLFNSCPLHRR